MGTVMLSDIGPVNAILDIKIFGFHCFSTEQSNYD